jgi:hypothetical protein
MHHPSTEPPFQQKPCRTAVAFADHDGGGRTINLNAAWYKLAFT